MSLLSTRGLVSGQATPTSTQAVMPQRVDRVDDSGNNVGTILPKHRKTEE
jgi:hypothetical protein